MVISNSENNFGYYSFTLIRAFLIMSFTKEAKQPNIKKRLRSKEFGLTQREVWPLSPVSGK